MLLWTEMLLSPSPASPHPTPRSLEELKLHIARRVHVVKSMFYIQALSMFGLQQPRSVTGKCKVPLGWGCSSICLPGMRAVNKKNKYNT